MPINRRSQESQAMTRLMEAAIIDVESNECCSWSKWVCGVKENMRCNRVCTRLWLAIQSNWVGSKQLWVCHDEEKYVNRIQLVDWSNMVKVNVLRSVVEERESNQQAEEERIFIAFTLRGHSRAWF